MEPANEIRGSIIKMNKDELERLLHDVAYKEVNYNRSVVNQLLYFSMIIIGAFFWFIINIAGKSILGLSATIFVLLLSFCVAVIIGLIGISISKQFRQENVQWNIINAIEGSNDIKEIPKEYRYDSYKIFPRRYTWMLLSIFCFLMLINLVIMDYCLFIAFKSNLLTGIVCCLSLIILLAFGWEFYNTGVKSVDLLEQ